MKFEGIYTPLVTPFHDDFALNKDALERTVEYLVDAGLRGIELCPARTYRPVPSLRR